MISRKSSLEKELETVLKQEQRYIDKYKEKKESFLNQKLAQKIPDGLQEKLDAASRSWPRRFPMDFRRSWTQHLARLFSWSLTREPGL